MPEGISTFAARMSAGAGKGGTVTLLVHGEEVGQIDIPDRGGIAVRGGADVGADHYSPVTDSYQAPFEFQGAIHVVDVRVTPEDELPRAPTPREASEAANAQSAGSSICQDLLSRCCPFRSRCRKRGLACVESGLGVGVNSTSSSADPWRSSPREANHRRLPGHRICACRTISSLSVVEQEVAIRATLESKHATADAMKSPWQQ